MRRAFQTPTSRCGATLVETLVACLILAVIAVGTAACLYLSQGAVAVQRNRRTALEVANGRLEELRAATYTDIDPPKNMNIYYIRRVSGVWTTPTTTPTNETVSVNGSSQPMRTTVQFVDANGGSVTYDCLRLTVTVQYGRNASDVVALETLKAP